MAELSVMIERYQRRLDVLEQVIDDSFAAVQFRTPVDTGRARKGWRRTVVDGYIYWTNDVEYMRALEYGHSPQAPGGMVRITLAELPAKARAALSGI